MRVQNKFNEQNGKDNREITTEEGEKDEFK